MTTQPPSKETNYRLMGVYKDGGTFSTGQMHDLDSTLERIKGFLTDKRSTVASLMITPVEFKDYTNA